MIFKELPSSCKPREKALLHGMKSLSDAEIIAIIIQCGNHNEDVVTLSSRLINEIGGVEKLETISCFELSKIKGIKKAKALKLLASVELGKRIKDSYLYKTTYDEPLFYPLITQDMRYLTNEKLKVIYLDKAKNIISFELKESDSQDKVYFESREIIKQALKNEATYVLLIHNHPSANHLPSKEDERINDILKSQLKAFKLKLIDNLIVTENEIYSLISNKIVFKYDD